jgi:predicted flap endonuclease-1-like 5' DNA nuclease
MGFTTNQWAIVVLVLVLGWLLGLLSRSGSGRWRRAYEEEHAARQSADAHLAAARARSTELERQLAGHPVGPGTAAAIGAAAAGQRDDLALIRGIGRTGETQLNEAGLHRYRQIEDLSAADEAALETRLGLDPGTIARDRWREQAMLLRERRGEEHHALYP